MRRICRVVAAALLIAPVLLILSCEKDSKSNTDLKVPDVPPAGSGQPKAGPAGSSTAPK